MRFLKWLDQNLEEYLMFYLSIVMVGIIFIQVIMRYVFNSSILWSEELARYCFIWIVFIGASYGIKKDSHIKIDVLLNVVNEKFKRALTWISLLVFLIFALILIVSGYQVTEQVMAWNQLSPALRMPMWMINLAIPVGMVLVLIRIIQRFYNDIKNSESC